KKIRAKTKATSESWIAAIFFVMNIVSLLKIADKSAIFLCFIAKYLIKTYRIEIYNYVFFKKTIS
ncbi:MAG: hypothetical protein ACPGR5_03055, partial [Chitinophagales bacterium]